MDYSDFLTLIQKHSTIGGVTSLDSSDSTGYLALINRNLKAFTRFAFSHVALNQTIEFEAGTATYSIEPMFAPLKLNVNGTFLRNSQGRIGPDSLDYVSTLIAANGTPTTWCISGDQQITVYPTAAATGLLVGYVEHSTITATGTVNLPDHIIDIAALWISMALRYPHMQGSDLFEQVLALDRFAAQKLRDYRAANRARFETPITRRSTVEQFYV